MRSAGWLGILVILAVDQLPSVAAEPLRLTMEECVSRAVAASLDLSASHKDIDVAQAALERSRAWMPGNPFFSGGAQHSNAFGPNYVFLLSQEIEIGGQRAKRIAAATEGVEKATWEQKAAEQTLIATVKTAFIQALVSADRVTVAQQGVDTASELANELAQGTHLSEAQRLDLNVARIQESRARRELVIARCGHDAAVTTLRRFLGLPHEQEIHLLGTPRTQVQQLPPSPQLIDQALRQRPDLAAMHHDLQRADLQLGVTKREAIPNLTLSGTVSRFEGETLAGGDVGLPIPVFQRKAGDIQEAAAERSRTRLQTERLEQTIAQEVADARRACVDAGEDLQTQQGDIVPKSEENVQLERRQYERGAVTSSDLIGLQIDLLTARRDYLDAVETYNASLIDLERLIGGTIETQPVNDTSPATP